MDVFAVIPAYNEELMIEQVVQQTQQYVDKVIVVDDGSNDNTFKNAERTSATVLRHDVNLGKGAALKTGCDFAFMEGAEYIVVLDGDGQHDPKEIPLFMNALENRDIVFGSRQFTKEMPSVLKIGNRGLSLLIKLLYHINLQDTQSGFRAFNARNYRKIRWRANDYSMESEMIARVGKQKLRYKELPISTKYLDRYKGTTIIDGMKIGFNMLLWRLRL